MNQLAHLRPAQEQRMVSRFDHLAYIYQPLEILSMGHALEQARFYYFEHLRTCRRILLLGDGDGRGLACALTIAPDARIDSVDASAAMLAQARKRLTPSDLKRVHLRHENIFSAEFESGAYDAVTSLFFLDCFTSAQVQSLLTRLRPAVQPGALWLHADFALPAQGWKRWRAQLWLPALYTFFRWRTGLTARQLPDSEALLIAAGFQPFAEHTSQHGLLRSVAFRSAQVAQA